MSDIQQNNNLEYFKTIFNRATDGLNEYALKNVKEMIDKALDTGQSQFLFINPSKTASHQQVFEDITKRSSEINSTLKELYIRAPNDFGEFEFKTEISPKGNCVQVLKMGEHAPW